MPNSGLSESLGQDLQERTDTRPILSKDLSLGSNMKEDDDKPEKIIEEIKLEEKKEDENGGSALAAANLLARL